MSLPRTLRTSFRALQASFVSINVNVHDSTTRKILGKNGIHRSVYDLSLRAVGKCSKPVSQNAPSISPVNGLKQHKTISLGKVLEWSSQSLDLNSIKMLWHDPKEIDLKLFKVAK
ncbi:hypothetical protein ATANTOWER_025712 [Ataeniobius toweri]|uniref:Uncharacterized protein n=1 Tax=Ataeniobius toweri TaxID=208326 RepID=A0ABU7AK78_9TELE|nr:hypothetical protein [Ataeniobius toweri]